MVLWSRSLRVYTVHPQRPAYSHPQLWIRACCMLMPGGALESTPFLAPQPSLHSAQCLSWPTPCHFSLDTPQDKVQAHMFPFLLKYLIKVAFSETSYKSKIANLQFLSTRQEREGEADSQRVPWEVKLQTAHGEGSTADTPSQFPEKICLWIWTWFG